MATVLASDADILKRIERFCVERDVKPTAFGRQAIGDANLITNLRANRSLTLKTAARIMTFIAEYPDATPRTATPTQAEAA